MTIDKLETQLKKLKLHLANPQQKNELLKEVIDKIVYYKDKSVFMDDLMFYGIRSLKPLTNMYKRIIMCI